MIKIRLDPTLANINDQRSLLGPPLISSLIIETMNCVHKCGIDNCESGVPPVKKENLICIVGKQSLAPFGTTNLINFR